MARQEKKRVAQAKVDIKAKPAARRAERERRKVVPPPPRYDDVFFQALSWLDELGRTDAPQSPSVVGARHHASTMTGTPTWSAAEDGASDM